MEKTFIYKPICLLNSMILVSIFLLFGCGVREGEQKTISLKFMTHETGEVNEEFYKELFEEFKKEHPNIDIKFIAIPWSGYNSKILTMTAGGTPPDIFVIGSDNILKYVAKDVLLNIKPFIEKSNVLSEKDFFPKAINAYKFDGKIVGKGNIYGLPKDWSCENMLFYNKDMFDEVGLKYPDGSWDENVLLQASIKLTKKDKRGFVTQYGIEPFWSWPLVYQSGGAIFSEDFKECVIDNPQFLEVLKFYIDLSNKYHVTQTIADVKDESRIFEMGRAAMKFGARYNYAVYEKTIKSFRLGVTPPVRWKGKKITTVSAVFGYAISKKTKYPQEAWELVELIVGPVGQKKCAQIGYNIPTLKSVAYSDNFLKNPEHPAGLDKMFVDEMEHAVIRQVSPYITTDEFFSIYDREEELVLMGKQSMEDGVKKIVKRVNEKMVENINRVK